jgi:hypothetical protein
MRLLKGFVTINALISNTPDVVSPIGEMSTWAMTYTKERGEYIDNAIPGYRLVSAKNIDHNLGEVPVDLLDVTQVLQVVRSFYVYGTAHLRPYARDHFRDTIIANFYDKIYNLNFGKFVDNGTLALPEWISWENLTNPGSTVKIWLANQAFVDQYDEYDTTVVPPFAPVDNFFFSPGKVKDLVDTIDLSKMMDKVQDAKGTNPETFIRTLTFNYIPPTVGVPSIPTNWNVLIYGIKGDNIDAIKDAIIEHILANSTHTRTQWEAILPDLFKRTEFVILPRWDLESVQNLEIQNGLYSSIVDPLETIDYATRNIAFYPSTFIQSNINIVPFPFNAISLVIVNGFNNIAGKLKLTDIFPDYIPVGPTSLDFNRMMLRTQGWVEALAGMLVTAESMDGLSGVPGKMRRIQRDGKLYLSMVYDNINFLMAAKINAMT